jgi:uncharacterized protein
MIASTDESPVGPSLENPPWGRRELLRAGLLIMLGAAALIVLAGVGMAALRIDPATAGGMSSPLLFGAGLGVYLVVIIAVYWFAVRRPGGSWALVGVRQFDWRWWLAIGPLFIVQMGGMAVINGIIVPFFTGSELENPQIEAITGGLSLSGRELILLLFLIAVVAPVAEELFFRGMLYPVLRRRWGPTWAILINAVLFALMHFLPILLPALFWIGLVFAWVRERSGSVIPSIVLHAVQNGLVVIGIFTLLQA